MDEAEALCDRIAIFRAGRVVDTDSPVGLVNRHADHSTVSFTASEDLLWLAECPGATAVQRDGTRYRVSGTGPLLAHVASSLMARGLAPADLSVQRATLEDVFLRISSDAAAEGEE
jgi:ABC-2 type transport system ATP-binding protein